MRFYYIVLLVILFCSACQPNQDEAFRSFYQRFQQEVGTEPLLLAFLEDKLAFDSILIEFSPEHIDSLSLLLNRQYTALNSFSKNRLSPELILYTNRTRDFIQLASKKILTDKSYENNPGFYDPRPRLTNLQENGDPSSWRVCLEKLSINYSTATTLLTDLNEEKARMAIDQGIQVYQILHKEVAKNKGKTTENVGNEDLQYHLQSAKLATKSFIAWARSLEFEHKN